jgi:hypothetical protein
MDGSVLHREFQVVVEYPAQADKTGLSDGESGLFAEVMLELAVEGLPSHSEALAEALDGHRGELLVDDSQRRPNSRFVHPAPRMVVVPVVLLASTPPD